jgi:uncharacterized protein (TIGR02217 family)
MAFHNVRLPEDVERGAQGGPRFKTTIMILGAGHEKRNIDWETTRGAWDIGYGIESKEDLKDVIDFFYTRQGRAHGFRFKDWSDFEVGVSGSPVTFATGDGTTAIFQSQKRYSSGGINYDRDLTRIVAGTIEVYVNGALQTVTTHYTIDIETGLITFVTPPTDTHAIALVCEYDVPVRFDTDALDITMEMFDAGSIPQIPIIELKVE